MQIQEKFHLSEEKVLKLLKHAGKGSSKQEDNLLAGGFDPNQVSKGEDRIKGGIKREREIR